MAYYYLTSQLPYLVYGQPAPFSAAAFKALCRAKLSKNDASELDLCVLDPVADMPAAPFIKQWYVWERALRLNLARYRAIQLRRDSPEPPAYPADASALAKQAASIESPLEAEVFLDEARWKVIESLQGLQYFHVNTLYAYLLKLLLMERRGAFVMEEGFAEYKRLYAVIRG
ncbi:MAG: hypothetical protein LBO67_06130 [Spirochaetaceae bacterium]|nr:hypothetical protein [Spirochaetaceae bacterium]